MPGLVFGTSVAAAGATLVVGAPLLGGGLAYVYSREAGAWRETAELRGPGTQPGDFFGGAVAVAGTTVVVGADDHDGTGAAYVFRKDGSGWHQAAELAGAGATGPAAALATRWPSGRAPSWSARRCRCSVPARPTSSRQDRRGWNQVAELRAKAAPVGGLFGASVAASGPSRGGRRPG